MITKKDWEELLKNANEYIKQAEIQKIQFEALKKVAQCQIDNMKKESDLKEK